MAAVLDSSRSQTADPDRGIRRFNPRARTRMGRSQNAAAAPASPVSPTSGMRNLVAGLVLFITLQEDGEPLDNESFGQTSMATTDDLRMDLRSDFFLRRLYVLCSDEDTEDDAIDTVYDYLAAIISRRDLDECDAVLANLDETRITPAVIASLLTVTASAKHLLIERKHFYRRARLHLDSVRDPETNERLLIGLA